MIRCKVMKLSPIGHLELTNNDDTNYFRNNENPFGSKYNRYPGYSNDKIKELPGAYLELIQGLDINLGARNHNLNNTNIVFSQGAASGFEQVIKVFFEPNKDSVLLIQPSFSVYSRVAKIHNIDVKEIHLTGENFDMLDIEEICKSKVKGIVLCDPNNPICNRINRDFIKTLVDSFKGLIIIDEAYVEYSNFVSNLNYIKYNQNVIILRTMSKAMGMAGLRIGAIIGYSDYITAISRVQLPFSISSCAANHAYSRIKEKDNILRQIAMFKKERNRFYQALLKFPFFSHVFGEDGGFLTVRTDYIDKIEKFLHSNRLEPVFKPEGMKNWIRISLGTREQNDLFIKALESFKG